MERGRLNVGLNYRVLPLMQIKGYYEVQYRDRGTAGWKVGHRYQAGFIVSGAKRNIKALAGGNFCNTHLLAEQMRCNYVRV